MTKRSPRHTQKGSVLIYILIAVALFAALAMVVSSMMRGSTTIGNEKKGVVVSEILSYARSLRESVQALKISNACEDTKISFEKSPYDGSVDTYLNLAAPTNHICHIFHPQGGGVGYQENFDGHGWNYTGALNIKGVGTEEPDLLAVLPVSREICKKLNERVDLKDVNLSESDGLNDGADGENILPPFKGTYAADRKLDSDAYEGKMSGCYLSAASDGKLYTFYQVLHVR